MFQHRRDHFVCLQARPYAVLLPRRKDYLREVDLMSTVEIAELLGVTRQRVDQLSRTDQFPEPAAELAVGRVWAKADVVAWAEKT